MGKRNPSRQPPGDDGLIATICYLHYEKQMKGKDIAALLQIGEGLISTHLREAPHRGFVRFELSSPNTEGIEAVLKTEFKHLRSVRIVPYCALPPPLLVEALGEAAADYFLKVATDAKSIGLSCGHTVSAFVDAIARKKPRAPTGCEVYPLLTLMTSEFESITPATLVSNLLRSLPSSKGAAFQLPGTLPRRFARTTPTRFFNEFPEIRALTAKTRRLDYYVLGIGYIGLDGRASTTYEFNSLIWRRRLIEPLRKLGAVGESVYQPFDATGKLLAGRKELSGLGAEVISLGLPHLQRRIDAGDAEIIAIAGGPEKHKAVYGALQARIFNVLVTDTTTAFAVLKQHGVDTERLRRRLVEEAQQRLVSKGKHGATYEQS